MCMLFLYKFTFKKDGRASCFICAEGHDIMDKMLKTVRTDCRLLCFEDETQPSETCQKVLLLGCIHSFIQLSGNSFEIIFS